MVDTRVKKDPVPIETVVTLSSFNSFLFRLVFCFVFSNRLDAPMACGLPDLPAFAAPANQSQLLEEKHGHIFLPTCQAGFVLRGSKVLRCVDGNWIGSEVTQCVGKSGSMCLFYSFDNMSHSYAAHSFFPNIAVECHPLVPVINGRIDLFPTRGLSNNSFNSVARYRCSDGYMIFGGDAARTCGLDGLWTGSPPFCRREKIWFKMIISRKHWKGMAPNAFGYARLNLSYWLCAATDCQLPRPILNAVYKLVDNHTKPGAIAQYTCSNGYVPQSNKPKLTWLSATYQVIPLRTLDSSQI